MTTKKPWKLLLALAANDLLQAAKAVGDATRAAERSSQQRQGLADALEHYQQSAAVATPASLLRNLSLFKKKLAAALDAIELQARRDEARRHAAVQHWLACKSKKDGFERLGLLATQAHRAGMEARQDKAADDTLSSLRSAAPPHVHPLG